MMKKTAKDMMKNTAKELTKAFLVGAVKPIILEMKIINAIMEDIMK